MKNLKKLNINPERLMKNEELKSIRGGEGSSEWALCKAYYYDSIVTLGSVCVSNCTPQEAMEACIGLYPGTYIAQCTSINCSPE
ncbi:MAG: hypothetical protein KK926_03980 [Methanomethylovorans sp.]|nr:hypothetical protein [Methanomethylovorans sp.]